MPEAWEMYHQGICTDWIFVPADVADEMDEDAYWERTSGEHGDGQWASFECLREAQEEPCDYCGAIVCDDHDFHTDGECSDVQCCYGDGDELYCWTNLTIAYQEANPDFPFCLNHREEGRDQQIREGINYGSV